MNQRPHSESMERVEGKGEAIRWDALSVLAGLALAVLPFLSAAESLLARWLVFDQAYSHGLFVLGASLFLCYGVLRDHRFPLRPTITGIVLASLVATGIALAGVTNIQLLQYMGLVGLWWAAVLAIVGWRAAWHFVIPIGFLFYAVPFWEVLAWPLQLVTVAINEALLSLRGIHFEVEGTFIRLLDIGTFEIANGCSRQRYLVIALTLATLFSALNLGRVRNWIALHALAIGLALVVNWIRVFVIILVGYETRMQTPLIEDHEFLGWILFVVAIVPMFYVANRLAQGEQDAPARSGNDVDAALVPAPGKTATAVGLLLAAVIVPTLYLTQSPRSLASGVELALPEEIGAWERSADATGRLWSPVMRGTDRVSRASYAPAAASDASEAQVQGGVWFYASQTQGKELFDYDNRIVDSERWNTLDRETVPNLNGSAGELLTLEDRYSGRRLLVAYSYYVGGRWATGAIETRIALVSAAVQRRRDGALVAAVAECSEAAQSCERAMSTLTEGFGPAFFERVADRLDGLAPANLP